MGLAQRHVADGYSESVLRNGVKLRGRASMILVGRVRQGLASSTSAARRRPERQPSFAGKIAVMLNAGVTRAAAFSCCGDPKFLGPGAESPAGQVFPKRRLNHGGQRRSNLLLPDVDLEGIFKVVANGDSGSPHVSSIPDSVVDSL
jgi:hypothetical protein